MAITSGGVGTVAASSTATVTPAYPDGVEAGDGLLLVRSAKPETTVFDTPAGWTLLGDRAGGAGVFGSDTGPMLIAAYWRIADGTETGALACTSQDDTFDVQQAFIARWVKDVGDWDATLSGGVDPDQGNDWTVTADPALPLDTGDVVQVVLTWPTDSARFWSDEVLTADGATITDLAVPLAAGGTGVGADMATRAHAYTVVSGSSTTGPTYVGMVNSATNVTGATVMVRLRAGPLSEPGSVTVTPATAAFTAPTVAAVPGPVSVILDVPALAFVAAQVTPSPGPVTADAASAVLGLVGGTVRPLSATAAARGTTRTPHLTTARTPARSGVRIR
jgi:hypothetical protein